jgi:hypothetical protein
MGSEAARFERADHIFSGFKSDNGVASGRSTPKNS